MVSSVMEQADTNIDLNIDGGTQYLGFPLQSKEAIRKGVKQLSSFNSDGSGKTVVISGGTRVGKSAAITDEGGIAQQLQDQKVVTYSELSELEELLANDKYAHKNTVIMPADSEKITEAITGSYEGTTQRLVKCCELAKEKGINLMLSIGINCEIPIFPNDYTPDDETRELVERRSGKLKEVFEALSERSDVHMLYLQRDPKKVFEMMRDIARSDDYQEKEPFDRYLHLLDLIRKLSVNLDGPAFQQIMEDLGQKTPNGEFSRAAEMQAKKSFDEQFAPLTPPRNDLPPARDIIR